MNEPMTADGVKFEVGMTLWSEDGEEFPDVLWTAENDHSRGRYAWKTDSEGQTTSRLPIAEAYTTLASALHAFQSRLWAEHRAAIERASEIYPRACEATKKWRKVSEQEEK
jgi:hypothetical protein